MAVSICDTTSDCRSAMTGMVNRFKPVMKLLASIVVIMFFMLYAAPRLGQVSWFKPMADFIEESDINANMYFYTEVEEFSEANINLENTMTYPPRASR